MTADPVRTLSLDALPDLLSELASVPAMRRELAELRREVEAMRTRRTTCPSCGCGLFKTIKTLPTPTGIKRRRECRGCGQRVTTYEVIG